MLRIKSLSAVLVVIAALLCSCNNRVPALRQPQGSPYEVVVVCSDERLQHGEVGQAIRELFSQQVEMLSRPEQVLDMIHGRTGNESRFTSEHRNRLIVARISGLEASIDTLHDMMARDQLTVQISAPDDSTLASFIRTNADTVRQLFVAQERKRWIEQARKRPAREVQKAIEDQFGFTITVPDGFRVRSRQENFLWASAETNVSQGMIIYAAPLDEPADAKSLNCEFMRLIPGEVEGTYMTMSDVEPLYSEPEINRVKWVRMAGFWDVEGDFMGGPMRSYTTTDQKSVITLIFYTYAPAEKQRNLMLDTENMIYTLKFQTK